MYEDDVAVSGVAANSNKMAVVYAGINLARCTVDDSNHKNFQNSLRNIDPEMKWTQVLFSNYFKRYVERELHKGKLRRQWHPLSGWKEMKRKTFVYNEHRPWTDEFKLANQLGSRPKKIFVQPIKDWNIFVGDRSTAPQLSLRQCYSSPVDHNYLITSQRALHRSNNMASLVPEGILLGIGNPLLDTTITADQNFLHKYGLESNNAIIATEKHMPMFEEMMTNFKPTFVAGGAIQNSIRVAQWLLGQDKATTFLGCVGNDEKGEILRCKGRDSGVNVQYQVTDKRPTGVCGAVITGEDRSLVAHLGAADFFEHCLLEQANCWKYVEQAQMYYIGGFFFPVCSQAVFDIAHHACDKNKTLAMNLSAPFLCKYFADKKLDIMPYIDVLFGNETEAATFCKLRGIEAPDLKSMAVETSNLPKANTKRSRLVVFTQGRDPTIIAKDGKISEHPIIPVQKEDIRDTNGCGDAFVGGFLSQLVQEKPISECLKYGQYAASVVIKHWGCTFPDKPDFK